MNSGICEARVGPVNVELDACLALALVAFAIAGCDEGTPTGPSNSSISGQVIDFASGLGVSGAAVVFGQSAATTDVGFNTTGLSVSHSGYADTLRPVGRGVGGVSRLDLDLERR